MQALSESLLDNHKSDFPRFKWLLNVAFIFTTLGISGQALGSDTDIEQTLCRPPIPDKPIEVTSACVDPVFSKPVIDSVQNISHPMVLHKVSGHFDGTPVTFNFYYPPKSQWRGRFFHNTYPFTDGEATDHTLKFGSESGAYTVRTGQSSGYRADAAAAKFSRQVAREYYGLGDEHIYGYVYGGSGGSYQTIAAIENSDGVWDGAVPYVMGTPTSIPTNFFVRVFARVVLLGKAELIADAMRPGGTGDPYLLLNPTESSVLREVTSMGVPLEGWADPKYLLGLGDEKGLMGFRETVRQFDPEYAADFWSKPGYLGTEKSALGNLFRAAVVDIRTGFILDKQTPNLLRLEDIPEGGYPPEWEFTLLDANQRPLAVVSGNLNVAEKTLKLDDGQNLDIEAMSKKAATVRIDNRWALALAVYHRYQVPHEPGIKVWDQFVSAEGHPKFPQRPEIGPVIARGASGGGVFTGMYTGKMILLGNLLDVDAFPWDADWYAARVKARLGRTYNDRFRVWFNQNADHHDGSVIVSGKTDTKQIRLVSYVGILEQSLRDLSAWVEQGVEPSPSTNYEITDGQVSVAAEAIERHGIQPVVQLSVEGGERATVDIPEAVKLNARVECPPGAGNVVRIELSGSGDDHFVVVPFRTAADGSVIVEKSLTFSKSGTYYPVLRVTTNRAGIADNDVAAVQNLARVRVVVLDR